MFLLLLLLLPFFVAVDMFAVVCLSSFSSGDSIVSVTALESGRSPHGGGQMELLRLRPLALPHSHPLAKFIVFFRHRLIVF